MAHFDLICKDCGHKFVVVTRAAIRDKQKRCPECESQNVRQTFGSFLQNGSLSSPTCGAPQRSSGYG
jgi:putative FmdB family regulatory protein